MLTSSCLLVQFMQPPTPQDSVQEGSCNSPGTWGEDPAMSAACPKTALGLQWIRVGEHAAQGAVPMTFRLTHHIADDLRLLRQEPPMVIMESAGAVQEFCDMVAEAADRLDPGPMDGLYVSWFLNARALNSGRMWAGMPMPSSADPGSRTPWT